MGTYTIKCEYCGEAVVRENRQRFCSHACHTKFRFPREISICEVCRLVFEIRPNRSRRFCSHECASEIKRHHVCSCGSPIGKCYGNMKQCEKCHAEYKYRNYLRRLQRKFEAAYGQDKIDVGIKIRKVEALSDVGIAKIKGDEKWLKNHKNEVRMAVESLGSRRSQT